MDVYRIGITITMMNNASTSLGVIQRDVLGLHKSVDLLTGGFTAAKAAAVGFGAALGGGVVLGGMCKLVDQGKELARQQTLVEEQLRHMPAIDPGWPMEKSANTTAQAWMETNEVRRSNIARSLTSARGLIVEYGDGAGMQRGPADTSAKWLIWPVLGKGARDQQFDQTGVPAPTGVSKDQANFTMLLDALRKSDVPSSGLVFSSEFLNSFKYGRTATQAWSNSFAGPTLPTAVASEGGTAIGGPGIPLHLAFQDLVRGAMTYAEGDLFGPLHRVYTDAMIRTKTGTMKSVQQSASSGTSEFQAGKSTAQNDPVTKIKAFQTTWNNLMTALGAPAVDTGTNLMVSLTHAMNDFMQCTAAHPELVGVIEKTMIALAALVAAVGLFAIGATAATALGFLAGPAGLIGLAAGIETLGKALPSISPWLVHLAAGAAAGSVLPAVRTATGTTVGAGVGLFGADAASDAHARASFVLDGTGGIWIPAGGSAVPPRFSSAELSGPMPVYVVNGRDIADGATAHQAAQMSAPPTGPTGGDPRMNLPMPAFGTIVGP